MLNLDIVDTCTAGPVHFYEEKEKYVLNLGKRIGHSTIKKLETLRTNFVLKASLFSSYVDKVGNSMLSRFKQFLSWLR
jgi:hypothetical protein